MKIDRIDRFIEKYPNQLAAEFKVLLSAFDRGEITKAQIQWMMKEKIDVACNTVKPLSEKEKFDKLIKKTFTVKRRGNRIGGDVGGDFWFIKRIVPKKATKNPNSWKACWGFLFLEIKKALWWRRPTFAKKIHYHRPPSFRVAKTKVKKRTKFSSPWNFSSQ